MFTVAKVPRGGRTSRKRKGGKDERENRYTDVYRTTPKFRVAMSHLKVKKTVKIKKSIHGCLPYYAKVPKTDGSPFGRYHDTNLLYHPIPPSTSLSSEIRTKYGRVRLRSRWIFFGKTIIRFHDKRNPPPPPPHPKKTSDPPTFVVHESSSSSSSSPFFKTTTENHHPHHHPVVVHIFIHHHHHHHLPSFHPTIDSTYF